MSADIKLKQVQLQLLQENEFLVPDEECNVIIPYVPSGYEDYSNLGFVKGQYKIDNFLTYKRLYTGNDAFIITWKGSTSIAKDLNANGQIQINWNLGEYILGYNEGHSSDVGFENDASFSEYKKHSVSNTLTFRIRADKYDLDENYKYLFYKVPEISKDILYRVVSLETEYIGRIKVCYVLTLQSLQQDLENTGRAKSQNVMPNAPGQGYYDPLIVVEPSEDEQIDNLNWVKIDKTRWLTIDKQKIWNRPCKYVVVKMFGLGILMNFSMVGRKVYANQSFLDYGIPRLIFPMNLTASSTPTLYRTQQSEDNFYYAYSLFPTIAFNKEIFAAIKDFTEINKVWTNQGLMYINSGDIKKTNPTEGERYKYSLFGQITNIGGTEEFITWKPELNQDYNVDTRGTYGTKATYKILKQARNIHDRLWDSYWTQKQISRLPIRKENTLTFGSVIGTGLFGVLSGKKIGIIAGSILFGIGLIASFVNQLPNKVLQFGLSGLIPCSLTDFMLNEASVSLPNLIAGKSYFKLNYFLNDDEQDFLTFFNTQTMNTSFEATLTDLFEKDGNTYETTLIGQTKHEDGSKIFNDGSQLLLGGGETLKEVENSQVGYIIDSFNLQSMFKGDFSVEFLDKDREVIWSGVYQSEAKWTGSIREINTWRNTSIYGRENIFLEEPKPWPEQIELAPWGQPKINIDVGSNMREFAITRTQNKAWSLEEIKQAYDGLIEDNFNNKQGPGFKLFGKTYSSGGKPWIKYHNSQERLAQFKTKDKILETYGTITKEAFFSAYEDIRFKVNMLGKTTEQIVFDKNSDIVVQRQYIIENTLKNSSIGLVADQPANYGFQIGFWVETGHSIGLQQYANARTFTGIEQIINQTSTLILQHKLIFEQDGVYIETTPLEKTIKMEYDYIAMSEPWKDYNFGNYPDYYKKDIIVTWETKRCFFGHIYKKIISDITQFSEERVIDRIDYSPMVYADNFSIGRILANKK